MTLEVKKAFLAQQRAKDDLLAVMSTPAGRRFIWRRILAESGVFSPSFIAGAPDVTAFNEGARNLGLTLLGAIMQDAPDQYLTMQAEAIHEDQQQQESSNDGNGAEADGLTGGGDSDH